MSRRRVVSALFALAAAGLALVAALGLHYDGIRRSDRRLMRVVYDDAEERVRSTCGNLRLANEVNDRLLLIRARALQRLLRADPSALEEGSDRLEYYRRMLLLDELHVSDERGILVRSIPASSLGFSLGAYPESVRFMPAITNRWYEHVQPPVAKVNDPLHRKVQYAGVARPDSPGVLQIGQRADFIAALERLADVDSLSRDSRIGRNGSATVRSAAGLPPIAKPEIRVEDGADGPVAVLEGDAEGYRIRVALPWRGVWLPDADWSLALLCASVLCFAAFYLLRARAKAVAAVAGGGSRMWVSPVTIALLLVFAVASALVWALDTASVRHDAVRLLNIALDNFAKNEEMLLQSGAEKGGGERLSEAEFDQYLYSYLARDWHIGRDGFFTCFNADTGEITSSGSPRFSRGDTMSAVGFDVDLAIDTGSRILTSQLYNQSCLCAVKQLRNGNRYVIAAIPVETLARERDYDAYYSIAALAIVFLSLVILMNRLSRIAGSLRSYIEADRVRRAADLKLARTVRSSTMPVDFPEDPRYRLSARLPPCEGEEIGGEYYDFFMLPSGSLFFTVGEVNARGISAAMEMMKVKALVKSVAAVCSDFHEAVERTNAELCRVNDAKVTVAAFFAVYNPETGRMAVINAGYRDNPLGGAVSPALGADPASCFTPVHLTVASGSSFSVGGILVLEVLGRSEPSQRT